MKVRKGVKVITGITWVAALVIASATGSLWWIVGTGLGSIPAYAICFRWK
jgi:hypothetical protein